MKRMKTTKLQRVMSFAVAVLLVLSMMTGFAVPAEEPTNGQITLNGPVDEDTGKPVDLQNMQIQAFRIFKEVADSASGKANFYTPTDGFVDFFADAAATFQSWEGTKEKDFYVTYDKTNKKLVLQSTEDVDAAPENSILVSYADIAEVGYAEDYFAAVLVSTILSADGKVGTDGVSDAQASKLLGEWLRTYALANLDSLKLDETVDYQHVTVGEDYDGSVQLNDLTMGYWLIITDNAPGDVTDVRTILKLAQATDPDADDTPKGVIDMKMENQILNKEVRNRKDIVEETDPEETDEYAGYDESTNATVGDIVDYHVQMTLPDLTDYDGRLLDEETLEEGESAEDFKFALKDTLHNQRLVGRTDPAMVKPEGNTFANFRSDGFKVTFTWETETGEKVVLVLSDDVAHNHETDRTSTVESLRYFLKFPESTYGKYALEEGSDPQTGKQDFILDFDLQKLREWALEHDVICLESEENTEKQWGYNATVDVEYSAELMSEALRDNENEATLDYSNDPHTLDPQTKKDKTDVYTYGMEFDKQFEDADGKLIEDKDQLAELYKDVTFNLYPAVWDTDTATSSRAKDKDGKDLPAINFTKDGADDGAYKAADGSDDGFPDLKLDKDGHLWLYGLDEGYYILEEVTAPNGYARVRNVTVYLDTTSDEAIEDLDSAQSGVFQNGDKLEGGYTVDNTNTKYSILQFSVLNQRGINLPDTGGLGTWMFAIGGVLLIALAIFLLVSQKKNTGSNN